MPKISQFPAGGSAKNTDLIPIVRNGGDYTITGYNLASLASYGQAYVGTFTATAGQTVFTLPASPGSSANLAISVDGSTMVPGTDYNWTTPTTLTFTTGLTVGQTVLYRYTTSVPIGTSLAGGTNNQIQYNNSGVLNGFTMSGDVTVVPTTGVATIASSAVTSSKLATGAVLDAALNTGSQIYAVNQTYNRTAAEISAGVTPTNYGYAPGDVRRYGADATGSADSTTAIQNAINTGGAVYLPGGTYKVTGTLTFPNTVSVFRGDGMELSIISCNGVSGAVLQAAAISYFRPQWRDFAIVGNSATGKGIDFSAVTVDVYGGALERISITSGDDCLYAPLFFSMKVDTVQASSYNGHGFRVFCGPAVSWINCYAHNTGANKAGYRLAGLIAMYSCNGVDTSDYWGVFGSNLSSGTVFQNDFASTDYPDIELIGCNIENFGSISTSGVGLWTENQFKSFRMIGGKIDRSHLSTGFQACIYSWQSLSGTNPVFLAPGQINAGSGTPSIGYLAARNSCVFLDDNGAVAFGNITTYRNSTLSLTYPTLTRAGVVDDVYNDKAQAFNAITPRRFSAQMIRYVTPAALTPVGAAQAINVTGYTKVTVTPAAAASITTATFTATIGAGLDYGRNGDLIIEAGNGNLTVNHSASGANTFRLSGAANVTMTTGQVIRFCWSTTSSQWIQV